MDVAAGLAALAVRSRFGAAGFGAGGRARDGVGLFQLALREINRRSVLLLAERVLGMAFFERVLRAAFNAAAAEGALAGIVAPGELAFAGLELDGARGAAESADGAAGAERGIELNQSAEARCDFWAAQGRAGSGSRAADSSSSMVRIFMIGTS